MNKTKISKIGRRGKTMLAVLIAAMFIGMASAALIPHFGQIKTTATVSEQAVQIGTFTDTIVWKSYNDAIEYTIPHSSPGGEPFWYCQWVRNSASIPVDVTFTNNDPAGITTTYYKDSDPLYTYSQDWGEVGVTVEDTGDGWITWTYTYPEEYTHPDAPQISVAINYPNGFVIHTADGHQGPGWYYTIDGGATVPLNLDWVKVSPLKGTNPGGGVNTMFVQIKKCALGVTFDWHGYAVSNGVGIWIELNDGVPQASATIKTEMTGLTLQSGQKLPFYICYAFALKIGEGTYTLTTTVDATESTT